jgi:iron complex transport system ATP-binding protein
MTAPDAVLQCRKLTVEVGGITVVRELDLTVLAGQCWCLLGRNGAGKTTLLHTLAGLRAMQSGTIRLGNTTLAALSRREVARRLAILFQEQTDSFPVGVREKVLQGRHPYLHAWQWESAADHAIVADLLQRLGLETLAARNVQTLSGGERQRVAVATLLAQQCRMQLLDEPTNHLDLSHRLVLLGMLAAECRDRRRALLMSLHDINLAARFCDHALLLLGDGETLHGPVASVLDSEILESLYGHPLIEVATPAGRAWLPA